jgi:hypothetical protein
MTTYSIPRPTMLYPGDPTPPGPHRDDDWFRYYGPRPGELGGGTTHYEVHEMFCCHTACAYRPAEPCPWHPADCACSKGQCQR